MKLVLNSMSDSILLECNNEYEDLLLKVATKIQLVRYLPAFKIDY